MIYIIILCDYPIHKPFVFRKSGIPVARQQRPRSTERASISNMNFLERMHRANSMHSLAGDMPLMTPARTPLSSRVLAGGGTARPARWVLIPFIIRYYHHDNHYHE